MRRCRLIREPTHWNGNGCWRFLPGGMHYPIQDRKLKLACVSLQEDITTFSTYTLVASSVPVRQAVVKSSVVSSKCQQWPIELNNCVPDTLDAFTQYLKTSKSLNCHRKVTPLGSTASCHVKSTRPKSTSKLHGSKIWKLPTHEPARLPVINYP